MTLNSEISVVISTYNRRDILRRAIESILFQDGHTPPYDVIVVDNNSTDGTAELVESFIARGHQNLRYILETKQGVSHARNAGIAAARAQIVAFFDDDVCVSADWISTIRRAFDQHPDVECVGGRVVPRWPCTPPPWLTREHWAPVALQDYGNAEFQIDESTKLCLLSANLAFRSQVFERIGGFAPELQRVKDGIGSMEDLELLTRFWRANGRALYLPSLITTAQVPLERLTKKYHRRWHAGNGRFYAAFRSAEIERSEAGRFFDVPAHLYRQALRDLSEWIKGSLRRRSGLHFSCETRLCFFVGFFRKRRADFSAQSQGGAAREIISFTKSVADRMRKA